MPPKNTLSTLKKVYVGMSAEDAALKITEDLQNRRETFDGLATAYDAAAGGKRAALKRRMNVLTAEIGLLTTLLQGYGSISIPAADPSLPPTSQSGAPVGAPSQGRGAAIEDAPAGGVPVMLPAPSTMADLAATQGLAVVPHPPMAGVIPIDPHLPAAGGAAPLLPITLPPPTTTQGSAVVPNAPVMGNLPINPLLLHTDPDAALSDTPLVNIPPPSHKLLATAVPVAPSPIPPPAVPAPLPAPPSKTPRPQATNLGTALSNNPLVDPPPPSHKLTVTVVPAAPPPIPPPAVPTPPSAPSSRPRPRPRPVVSQKAPKVLPANVPGVLVKDEDEVKVEAPLGTVVDANIDTGGGMSLMTPGQAQAMLQATKEMESGVLLGKRRNTEKTREGGPKKKRAEQKVEESTSGNPSKRKRAGGEGEGGTGGAPSKKVKAVGKGKGKEVSKGKGKERPQVHGGANAVVEGGMEEIGDDEEAEEDDSGEESGNEGGSRRKRAPKQQRTGWVLVTLPFMMAGRMEEMVIRIPVPFLETAAKRALLNRKGWKEVHNALCGGINPSSKILVRCKKFRWFCGEIGAISRLLSLTAFILKNKRTRCHFHAGTDRGSSHNDEYPKISKATGEASHTVTGVALAGVDGTGGSEDALRKWHGFRASKYPGEFPAPRNPERCVTRLGGMTEEDLLSFFHLHENGRRYLGCGCDLEYAIFDFFLWKTAPHLFSETTGNVECIGTPWDVRLRPSLVSLCAGMGFGPDNLDTMFKFNSRGELNDLSTAPQFVRDFWATIDAEKATHWPDTNAPAPRRRQAKAEYVDPEDIEGGEEVEFESDDETPSTSREAKTFSELNEGEEEEEEEENDSGEEGDNNNEGRHTPGGNHGSSTAERRVSAASRDGEEDVSMSDDDAVVRDSSPLTDPPS